MGYLESKEHREFRELIAQFVAKEMRPYHEEWERDEGYPRELLKKLGDLGVLGLRVGPEYGGSGLDYWYTVILCEELVRSYSVGVSVSILAHAEFSIKVIDDVGSDEQRREYLVPALRGETVWGLGLTEPDFGSNVGGITTTAKRVGDDFVINGAKTFISNGSIGDYIMLAVRTGEAGPKGISLVIFPADTKGYSAKKLDKMAVRSSDTGMLYFDDCRIPAKNLVGKEGYGFGYIMDHFQGERLVLSCFGNGVMEELLKIAVDYGTSREIFGKPILSHQVWKHRLADCYATMVASKQLTYHACDVLNTKGDANRELSAAKLFSSENVKKIANEVLQLHGGYGAMNEYVVTKLYRDVSAFTIGAGTSEIMREIISRTMVE